MWAQVGSNLRKAPNKDQCFSNMVPNLSWCQVLNQIVQKKEGEPLWVSPDFFYFLTRPRSGAKWASLTSDPVSSDSAGVWGESCLYQDTSSSTSKNKSGGSV